MSRFKTQWTAKEIIADPETGELVRRFPDKFEENTMPSKTIPDQSLTVAQIRERIAKGLDFDDVSTPIYHGDEDVIEWDRLDLSERQDIAEQAKQNLQKLKGQIDAKAKRTQEHRIATKWLQDHDPEYVEWQKMRKAQQQPNIVPGSQRTTAPNGEKGGGDA